MNVLKQEQVASSIIAGYITKIKVEISIILDITKPNHETKPDNVGKPLVGFPGSGLSGGGGVPPVPELSNGKLVNACGLGGLCKAHSKLGEHLSLKLRK